MAMVEHESGVLQEKPTADQRPLLQSLGDPGTADAVDPIDFAAAARLAELAEKFKAQPAISPIVVAGLARGAEFLLILLTGVLIYFLYLYPVLGLDPVYAVAVPSVTALAVMMFEGFDIYHIGAFREPVLQGFRLCAAWILVFLLMLAAIFFLKRQDDFSRVWLAAWFFGGLFVLALERAILSVIVLRLSHAGRLDCRTVIVGGGDAGESLLQALAAQSDTDLSILGFFDDRTEDRSGAIVAGFPKLGNVDELVAFARSTRIDIIIFALPISAEKRILQMLRKLSVLPVDIRLAAHSNKLRFRPRSYSYIGKIPVLDVMDKPIADWNVVLKNAFDKIVGTLALVAFSPLLLLIAFAVKLDSKGPVLFKQRRYGFNNELIEIYKFRSMYTDRTDATASQLVTKDDPRVTRVGRIIRKLSLDELPQLFNVVFKGNLSLVGPRPHAIHAKAADRMYAEVVDGYFARHRVRPGITGWAQVNGWRGETDTAEKIQNRVEHDLYYIENWSISFDLYILAITPFALLKTSNAY
jgi:Undecaprenyl-phosphate glucose phosphotransferase